MPEPAGETKAPKRSTPRRPPASRPPEATEVATLEEQGQFGNAAVQRSLRQGRTPKRTRRKAQARARQNAPELLEEPGQEVNQSFPEELPPEVNQSFPEEPPLTSSAEPVAEEEALRPGEAEKLKQIRELANERWVDPFDEAKIEDLWESFGDRLPKIAGDNLFLWLDCLDVGAEVDELPQVTRLQDQFKEDIKQIVSNYLLHNFDVVLDEMRQLGLPMSKYRPVSSPTELQAEQTRELQAAAASLAKLQTAQAQARRTYVGYRMRQDPQFSEMSPTWPTWSPVTFDPYAPKPELDAPESRFFTPIRREIVPYEQIKEKYDQASDAITDLLLRYPALFAFTREGPTHLTAAVTAGFAATESPQQAREYLATALRQVLDDIEGALEKLGSGDLEPLDLTPIHEQLFAGKRGKSGVDWSERFPRWAATDAVGDHQFHEALVSLGLQAAAAALFLLAPFTGGASLYLMLGGLAVTGAKFYLSQDRYETLAQAAKTSVTPGTELVTPQQVEAAEQIRNADAIALALAALVVGAAVGAKLIGAIRGPVAAPTEGLTSATKATGSVETVPPAQIRFSQTSVGKDVDQIALSMRKNGWQGDAIDVVRMPDGQLTTLDNTRVLAAHRAGINVQARVHPFEEPINNPVLIDRFSTKKGVPTTWGDAASLRIGKQSAGFRTRYPQGSLITGSSTEP